MGLFHALGYFSENPASSSENVFQLAVGSGVGVASCSDGCGDDWAWYLANSLANFWFCQTNKAAIAVASNKKKERITAKP